MFKYIRVVVEGEEVLNVIWPAPGEVELDVLKSYFIPPTLPVVPCEPMVP